ncbi:hypothetical protein [Streptacidiphilus carbonis]|uniref:hypothetical protein n=1 Tax=Streptacidiphilus carbonis TaxID=105422 RepID=UPI0005AB88C4|nr:hypothetical protein [Streptacidiphilus carbonis]
MSSNLPSRRRTLLAAGAAALSLTLSACASTNTGSGMPAMSGMPASTMPTATAPPSATASMAGMAAMAGGTGLASSSNGYTFASATAALPAGQPAGYRFTITGPDGKPVTDYTVDQTKKLHFYAIRSDLTGFQHVHPTMAADGTWTAQLAAPAPGDWRLFAAFTPATGAGKGTDVVLSRTVTVPGMANTAALPPAATSTTVDGYTATVSGDLMAGMAHPLTVTISRDGKPVTDLQPYLDTYAHLTAFHEGDQAFAHLHPTTAVSGDHGGPTLTFHAELPASGNWRLFLQFQTVGTLHTAQLTLHVS